MHGQAFTILEYDELLTLLRGGAQTPMGQARVAELKPFDNVAELKRQLAAVSECVDLRKRSGIWTFSELADPALLFLQSGKPRPCSGAWLKSFLST
jgi:dsDNA-specific endonuclease/ATPase MutS2